MLVAVHRLRRFPAAGPVRSVSRLKAHRDGTALAPVDSRLSTLDAIVRTSPSQLQLLTMMVGLGVLLTYLQLEAIHSWTSTVTVHLSMGLVAAGAFLAVVPPLSRNRRDDR